MTDAPNLIQTAGTPLAAWQGSHRLAAVPAISLDELAPPGHRVVVVAPHPDDEVIACGGLLAALTEREQELLLVSVTDGEGSHPGSLDWPPERLREARYAESEAALRALGLAPERLAWQRLHAPDSQVGNDEAGLAATLRALLRPTDLVFTTWRLDGHCDHEAVARACLAATADAGAQLREIPVWAWHWATPEDDRLPWERARRLTLTPQWLARKQAALHAHQSQLHRDPTTGADPVLSEEALRRWLQPYEVVFL
ncbi:PIG-L deacetylase family protein [Pseudomonas japonica]|uniref:PIG-L deacetylase family protein n=1 Tax=Pseudomonas japonica TaxID=256466 RepID=UPI0015E3F238|nr:PIG-L family deacetylase [Pseudomonas japonica]MBA1242533.1 PIG-L family deacetylase [Pseudomonas japonica]